MTCNETTSGFVKPDDILKTDRFTDFSPVSSNGFSLLVRAKRHGRWWLLKGLKEQYRQDTVYQVLLQKEYEIACQLQHPMIVSVFSLEEVEGLGLCIVMEWIEGLTLKEWLAQGKHSRKQRRHVADMLMEALAYVQSRQTQHRDLKPSNIMLTHDGQYLKAQRAIWHLTGRLTFIRWGASSVSYAWDGCRLWSPVNVVRQVIGVIPMLRPSREICTVAGSGHVECFLLSAL